MNEARKVVLIVDDEAGIRDMLCWTLAGTEIEVRIARDGEEASAQLSAGGVDLVITDMTMPLLGGFGVLAAAAATSPRTPVIMMTGFGTVEMAVLAMRGGASDFLLKPFDARRLAALVQETLRTGASPSANLLRSISDASAPRGILRS